ncbi:MAG: AAA family ATPase [Deltaproteobacteria bacterium]|nr:AAA family ATPase [Deltaproteobacteria bacterium]MBW1995921.1 AAA family ATPase [Deltaproteobacteria bacterium]MBW2151926.1 AAA family ATPase [Deltaproteobacteria bacterium]
MYQNYFGFKENPFKLVPNPAYLFLSSTHEEAMAHLTYAVIQGDGFVEITGEVGTGKTTLCRAFLENLNDNAEAAYIFNPKLNSIQLLKAINDEFGIPSDADNTKDLIDTLNSYLIAEKAKGKNIVLLIDEAQNLDQSVLEQIRLLSNLETTRSKLLQIILVGQPELAEMLTSRKLRQLGQRITLSCALRPLSYSETREYIQHRINIASQKSGVKFSKPAVQEIYKYSRGIPRLINIACDRALLAAYCTNQQQIDRKTAKAAIRELTGKGQNFGTWLLEGHRGLKIFAGLCVLFLLVMLYPPNIIDTLLVSRLKENKSSKITRSIPPQTEAFISAASQSKTEKIKPMEIKAPSLPGPDGAPRVAQNPPPVDMEAVGPAPSTEDITEQTGVSSAPEPAAESRVQDLGDILRRLNPLTSRETAMKAVIGLWNIRGKIRSPLAVIEDNEMFFKLAARQNGLINQRIFGDLSLLEKLNLPAILEFIVPSSLSSAYLTLCRLDDQNMTFIDGTGNRVTTTRDEVKSHWTGVAYILWKNFLNCWGEIPEYASRESIITLKMIMKEIGFHHITLDPTYDEPTREAVKAVQRKHGLLDDGIVGPFTKIILYNEYQSFKIPHIRTNRMEGP